MKKVLSLIVVLITMVVLFGVINASAATSGKTGSCTWSLDGTKLTISGNGDMGYTESQPWGKNITELVIEEGVTNIGQSAFANCTKLKSVTISGSVKTIGMCAFQGCSSLKSIEIPEGVVSIKASALSNCASLEKISFPKTLTEIEYEFLIDCPKLLEISVDEGSQTFKSVDGILFNKSMTRLIKYPNDKESIEYTVPSTVTEIGYKAFMDSWKIYGIKLHDNIKRIEVNAFYGTVMQDSPQNLVNGGVYIDDYFIIIADEYAQTFTLKEGTKMIADGAFVMAQNLQSVNIPQGVESIGDSAFFYCNTLEKISIPQSVTYIGDWAFYACDKLEKVFYGGEKSDKKGIDIKQGNEPFSRAKWVYDACYASEHHSWGNVVVVQEADCLNTGLEEKECWVCKAKRTEEIPIDESNHDYKMTSKLKEPTCTKAGLEEYVCLKCGYSEKRTVNPLGHIFGEWIDESEPTCAKEGSRKRICGVCDEEERQSIDVTEHRFGEWSTESEPTCEEEGVKKRICEGCGKEEEEKIDARGHKFESATVLKEPTIMREGLKEYKCKECGETRNETIPMLEMDEEQREGFNLLMTAAVAIMVIAVLITLGVIALIVILVVKNRKRN